MANKKHVQPRTKYCDYCNGRHHFNLPRYASRNKIKKQLNQVEESSYEYEENSKVSDNEDHMYLHPVYAVNENTSRQEMYDKWYKYVEVLRICEFS